MSKLSFRARQVDYSKPLPVYMNHDLPDLQDIAAINRAVPQMPTGMEKDEEAEHHLQRALSALQAFGGTSTSSEYAIPTPKVAMVDEVKAVCSCDNHFSNTFSTHWPFSISIDRPKVVRAYLQH